MYEDRTPEKIKEEIAADLSSIEAVQKRGAWETREGSFADDQVGPMAVQLSNGLASLNEIRHIIWVDETSGPYIDLAADDMGIEPRKLGTSAQVSLQITGEAGYVILSGSTFTTKGNLCYLTGEDAVIPENGVVTVLAEAADVGAIYNVGAGTITLQFDNASEITVVTNPESAKGGTDPESDASLFARVELARKKPRTSANKYDYEEWALEVDGVDKAQVFPLRYGRGTVMVLIADENRKPVDQSVIDKCAAHIEDKMTLGGIELTVKTPSEVAVSVAATVITDGTETLSSIQQHFKAALEQYFSDISLVSSEVVYNQVSSRLISTAGVRDHSSLTLNGQSQNIALTDEQVPVVGEVVVT